MSFRIPKQHKPVLERVQIRLEQSLRETLDQFCQYLESDRDYVVAELLKKGFQKEKGFITWRAAHPSRPAATTAQRE